MTMPLPNSELYPDMRPRSNDINYIKFKTQVDIKNAPNFVICMNNEADRSEICRLIVDTQKL